MNAELIEKKIQLFQSMIVISVNLYIIPFALFCETINAQNNAASSAFVMKPRQITVLIIFFGNYIINNTDKYFILFALHVVY